MSVLVLVSLAGIATVATVVIVLVAVRPRAAEHAPRCGNCGYNLTGAPSNRCPECGVPFIEAGIVTKPPRSASRRAIRVLLLVGAGFILLAAVGWVILTMHTKAAKARVMAARQAAIQAEIQAQADAQQTSTTAPAAEADSAERPADTPDTP